MTVYNIPVPDGTTITGTPTADTFNYNSFAGFMTINGAGGIDTFISKLLSGSFLNPGVVISDMERWAFGPVAQYIYVSWNNLTPTSHIIGNGLATNWFTIRPSDNVAVTYDISKFTTQSFAGVDKIILDLSTVTHGVNAIGAAATSTTINGTAKVDNITAGSRNDVAYGAGGNDKIDLKGGDADVAVYTGKAANYENEIWFIGTTKLDNGTSIGVRIEDIRPGSPDGKDDLLNAEQIQYSDFLNHVPKITTFGGKDVVTVLKKENTALVTTVKTSDKNVTDGEQDIDYSLLGPDRNDFAIDLAGNLKFKLTPDFEHPTDSNQNNIYSVIVKADDGNVFDAQWIIVKVLNIPGVTINGTNNNDTVGPGQAPPGEKKPTNEEDIIKTFGDSDTIAGLGGGDKITPGTHADILKYFKPAEGGDTIFGFTAADGFAFKKAAFGNLSAITASHFLENDSGLATTLSQRFIFEIDEHKLWYDGNGSAAGQHYLIANLPGVPHLELENLHLFL